MFLRLEKPTMRMDGSWSTDIELVNTDRVARFHVMTDTIKQQVFTLLVVEGENAKIGRYYLGLEGMTVAEIDQRLGELHRGIDMGLRVAWSMKKDHEAKTAGEKLPSALE